MGSGAWGWRGKGERTLEFPAGEDTDPSPSDRACIRYNRVNKAIEGSVDGSDYGPLSEVGSRGALAQPDFYIDSGTGDDANDGATTTTALKTLNEYIRRIGDGVVAVVGGSDDVQRVYLSGDFNEGNYIFRGHYPDGVEFYGERTIVGTGSITTVPSTWDKATSSDGQIEDTAIPTSWTASGFVGDMIVLTSGANAGAVAWLGKDLGSKTVRHSPFAQLWDFLNFVQPAVSDTYDVVTLTKITGKFVFQIQTGGWGFSFIDLHLDYASNLVGIQDETVGYLYLAGCALTNDGGEGYCNMNGYVFDAVQSKIDTGGPFYARSGDSAFISCLLVSSVRVQQGANFGTRNTLMQNDFLGADRSTHIQVWGSGRVNLYEILGYYDEDNVAGFAVQVSQGANCYMRGKLFGTGNAGYGVRVAAASSMIFLQGDNFTDHLDVTTSGVQVRLGATDTDYATIGTLGVVIAANNAMIVPTE